MCKLHKSKADPDNTGAREAFYLTKSQYDLDSGLPNRWYDLFTTEPNRRRAILGALLMFGNQFLGVYVISNYGVLIYNQLGEGSSISLLLNACWTTFTL